MIELRQYQKDSVKFVREKFLKGLKIILLVITGGGGKSTIAGHMIYEAQKKGIPCLFIAHRKELIKQFAVRIEKEFGVKVGIIMGNEEANPFRLVQVASIQTLQRREMPPAGFVVIDEAHRVLGPKYIKVINHYKDLGSYILGLTGTPFSANKRVGLNTLFNDYVANIKCSELLEVGGVVPIKAYGAGSVSSKGMKSLAGDFRQDHLMKAFDTEKVYVNLISNVRKFCEGKKTIIFCCSVAHSISVTQELLSHGYKAMHIDGETPSKERDDAVRMFRSGEIQFLVNCSIACEGLDIPDCVVEILAVATKSKIKYLQCTWRIMRPDIPSGKTHGILIDLADNYERFAEMGILPDGDIEVSLDPECDTESNGVAPVKLCPSCSYLGNASLKICPDCTHVFTKSKKEIEEEEFIELQKVKKERRWKNYKHKDVYKVEDKDLEAFAKVKGYKPYWAIYEREKRKLGRKNVKIKNFPGTQDEYYKKVKQIEKTYYDKKALDPTEVVFLEENKAYIVFEWVKKVESLNVENI